MDEETKGLLHENLDLAKENNEMLRAMRRSMRIAHIMSFLYWTFIIGTAIGAYYFIQPYLDPLLDAYSAAKGNLDTFNDALKNIKP